MGRILSAYIVPHAAIVIPEVGRGEENKVIRTLNAYRRAAREIGAEKPSAIIITTPHAPVFQDFIHTSVSERMAGDLSNFGVSQVQMDIGIDLDLTNRIIDKAAKKGIPCGGLDSDTARRFRLPKKLDHGTVVPLYFIQKELSSFRIVHISIAGLPFDELYRFGTCIAEAVAESDREVVFVASGDLSHRLLEEGPYSFHENGPKFDKILVDSVKDVKPERLLALDEEFCDSAGECGLRSFLMMFGAFDGRKLKSEVYSYEGPFGVGYAIARIEPTGEASESILEKMKAQSVQKTAQLRKSEDEYTALARKTLETYVRSGKVIEPPQDLPDEMLTKKAGTFVSIKKDGRLRGCIGTIHPARRNIAEEIIHNAISSGTQDSRFEPVEESELDSLVYSVDVLKEPEPISSMEELDVKRYGVIVRCGMRSGLLLPNLEGVDTPEQQVSIALQKAGIRKDEKYTMERFEVVRHK